MNDLLQRLAEANQTKLVLLIMDGLGGLPREPGGLTELETALTPNLDALAARSSLGLTTPVSPGITVGSGPGHLAIFGYDPLEHEIGRGALEALGVDFDLHPGDVAARGNFCAVNAEGILTDRRAGRLPSEQSALLVEKLRTIRIPGAECFIELVREHRFAFILRGEGLSDELSDTDPQKVGVKPLQVFARKDSARHTADLLNQFIEAARGLIADQQPANMIMLRGFARLPTLPSLSELYHLKPAAIAIHGMYRGVSRLAGMTVLDIPGKTLKDQIDTLEKNWHAFDYFYIHAKKTDLAGEIGDFDQKVKAIEEVDAVIPRILALNPDVVVVTGDHSTPAVMSNHSWHPIPALLYGKYVRPDGIAQFGERACQRGSLGNLPARQMMALMLANGLRLVKYDG